MSNIRIPSWSEIAAVSKSLGKDSDAPWAWKGLVGAWPLQEGGGATAFDVSGYGNHGTLTNMDPATDWVVSDKGRALDFDGGTLNRVAVGNPSSLQPSLFSGLTITVSAFKVGLGNWDALFDKGFSFESAANHDINFGVRSTNRIWFTVSNGTTYNGITVGSTAIDEGSWRRYTATWTGGTETNGMKVYRDGLVIDQATSSFGISTVTSSKNWSIAGFSGSYRWSGRLLDSRIYSRALTPSEIAADYADPWAMYRLRRKVFAATLAPTGNRRRRLIFS